MVGSKMLVYLDQRLCQIFRSQDVSFGGKSIIVFGDLKQLGPVGYSQKIHLIPVMFWQELTFCSRQLGFSGLRSLDCG